MSTFQVYTSVLAKSNCTRSNSVPKQIYYEDSCFCAILTLFVLTIPAFAGVTVNSPSNDESVSSPFTLSASSADLCISEC